VARLLRGIEGRRVPQRFEVAHRDVGGISMVVRCPSCTAAYKMDAGRIPAAGVRVRCPRCAHIFRVRTASPVSSPATEVLAGIERDERIPPRKPVAAPVPAAAREAAPARPARPAWNQERTLDLENAQPSKGPAPRLETAPFRPGGSEATPATAVAAAPATPATAPSDERARRLARVLVSDILVYNQAARDRALGEGNLPVALAAEINKAWDLYKSKVSAEIATGTTFFKDALNEILADGAKVF
jgi:predicted Zn finger-like uncharacterized protein